MALLTRNIYPHRQTRGCHLPLRAVTFRCPRNRWLPMTSQRLSEEQARSSTKMLTMPTRKPMPVSTSRSPIKEKPNSIYKATNSRDIVLQTLDAKIFPTFVLARAACGLGAGGMMTMGSIITSDLVPIEIRGAYQSYVHIVFGAGSGGAIANHLGWRWDFSIQIPLLAVAFAGACLTTQRDLGLGAGVSKNGLLDALKLFDYRGSLLLTTSVTFLVLGLVSSAFSLNHSGHLIWSCR